jgi:hypothetical protein
MGAVITACSARKSDVLASGSVELPPPKSV